MTYSDSEEGVRVVMSSAQLAAVLTNETISSSATLTNRLWGGARVVGGLVELVGAGILCAVPEPTMASKVGCVVFGMHGADTTTAGAHQLWSGREADSLTQQGATKLAQTAGAGSGTAKAIGLAVDIAVPVALSAVLGTVRVAAIHAGNIKLVQHEAVAGGSAGGHTILKHVGRTEQELRKRLTMEPRIPRASSFSTLRIAESAVSKVMKTNAAKIRAWAQTSPASVLVLSGDVGKTVGYGVVRSTGQLVNMRKVMVVLRYKTYNGQPYFILTSYPIP
jgi:hypothetical protein